MQLRNFGRTGMQLSILGFRLRRGRRIMVRGDPAEQERTIAHALEAGVNYFDTAVQYGDGESEKNLGRVLQNLKPANAVVGTKVRLPPATFGHIADTITASLDGSLSRLRLERADMFHLHNPVTLQGGGTSLNVRQVLDEVVPAFERLRAPGKNSFPRADRRRRYRSAASGDRCRRVRQCAGRLQHAQSIRRGGIAGNYPAQDYELLFAHTQKAGVGVVGIRVLAGGALSGSADRHPIASPAPEPIGSAMSFDADIDRARRLMPLVKEGFASSLTEAATRFAISHDAMGTILVGLATPQEFEHSLQAVLKGPLPQAALDLLATLREGFSGEPR